MQRLLLCVLLAGQACGTFGCVSKLTKTHDATDDSESDAVLRTYMQEQTKFEQLRAELAPIVRQVTIVLPLECDSALIGISDVATRDVILDVGAMAGIYSSTRAYAPDPRIGLADLIITSMAIRQALVIAQAAGPYPSMNPMIATIGSVEADLKVLGAKWLTPEALEQIRVMSEEVTERGVVPLAGRLKVNQLLAIKFRIPASIQIDSSFVQFDDNGVLERGLGEMHALRISAEEAGDLLATMPLALEFRARRAVLATLYTPEIVKLREEFSELAAQSKQLQSLQELKHLESLDKLVALDKLGALDQLAALDKLGALDKLSGLEELKSLRRLEQLDNLDGIQSLKALDEIVAFRWVALAVIAFGLFGQAAVIAWAMKRGK